MPRYLEDAFSPGESLLVIFSVIEAIDAWLDSLDRPESQAKAVGALEGMLEGSRDMATFRDCLKTLNTELLVVAQTVSVFFLCQIEPAGLRQNCANASFVAFASRAKSWGNGCLALFLVRLAELNSRRFDATVTNSVLMDQVCLSWAREFADFLEGCEGTAGLCKNTAQDGWLSIAGFITISCQALVDHLGSVLEEFIL